MTGRADAVPGGAVSNEGRVRGAANNGGTGCWARSAGMTGAGGGALDDEAGGGVFGAGEIEEGETGAGEIGLGIVLPLGRGRSSLSIPDFPPVLCATCVATTERSAAKSEVVVAVVSRKPTERADIEENLLSEAVMWNHAFLSGGGGRDVPCS